MQIAINGHQCKNATEAIQQTTFFGEVAISISGLYFAVSIAEFDRIERFGIQPTKYNYSELLGRIVSVPGRHG